MLWRVSPGRSRRTPPAGFILPCQPLLVPKLPAGCWLHEVKHDGYTIIARKDGSRVTLWSRCGTNFTDRLPKIAEAVCGLAAESALIDGEAVAVRPDGHSDFAALRTKAGSGRACFVAFDLLRGRRSARIRQGLPAGPGGDRLEARRKPIFERKQPAMAEVEEPGVCAGVGVPPRCRRHRNRAN